MTLRYAIGAFAIRERCVARWWLVVLTAVMTGGCELVRPDQFPGDATTLKQEADLGFQACKERYSSKTVDTAVARAKCLNDADHILRSVTPYPDLLDLRMGARTTLAEKVENGQITITEAAVLMAQVESQLLAEEQRRIAVIRSIGSRIWR